MAADQPRPTIYLDCFVSVFQTNGIAASVILYPALIDIPFQNKQIWARRIDSRVVI
jgi:hypothetical protein